ncbi:MAG: HAMP domain-containing sensor histidine kinase [Verrucomicrobiota bacterium]|nr:HAMP domain-containing sensor histidine kinase [Verrucomicrobiota bacterium]
MGNKQHDQFLVTGRERSSWPVFALFIAAVLLPSLSLVWTMNRAMQNEQHAIKEKLVTAYRAEGIRAQKSFEEALDQFIARAERTITQHAPSVAFQKIAVEMESALLLKKEGRFLYPVTQFSSPPLPDPAELAAAESVEFEGQLHEADQQYKTIIESSGDPQVKARGLLGRGRIAARKGHAAEAAQIFEQLGEPEYSNATDARGRLIAPNALLRCLQLTATDSPRFGTIAARLEQLLNNYDLQIPSSQRIFLMQELLSFLPDARFPTLEAEKLAVASLEARGNLPGLSDIPIGESSLLIPEARLLKMFQQFQESVAFPELKLELSVGPGLGQEAFFASQASGRLPGYLVVASLSNQELLTSAAKRQRLLYWWGGGFVILAVVALAYLSLRFLQRETRLAQIKNDLVANVSHELKTPLSSMRLLIDTLLETEKPSPMVVKEYLELMSRENQRLTRLIENFLTFSRISRNKLPLNFELLDPAEVAEEAIRACGDRLNATGVRFTFKSTAALPRIKGDRHALSTALINLLENALKYSGEQKEIRLSTFAENGDVIFTVRDNGIGIEERHHARIFERFYQVDQTLSKSTDGCGLGLSIVQHVAQAHGGEVGLQSKAGAGSEFTLKIPASQGGVYA